MSTVRLQQLLALKEELGPPELQPHERFSALQAQRQAASPGGSSGGGGGGSSTPSSPSLQQQHELHRWFPFGAELLQSPVKWRLDPRSQDPRMQELTAALHQFVRPVAAGGPPGAFETLCSVRNTLFDIIIAKVWGARVFESRGVAGLDVLNDLVRAQPTNLHLLCTAVLHLASVERGARHFSPFFFFFFFRTGFAHELRCWLFACPYFRAASHLHSSAHALPLPPSLPPSLSRSYAPFADSQALDQLLKCFCKVVHTYKKQQLLLNYGGDENVFRLQKGDQAVRQWCLVVFEGTDTATIKQVCGW